MCRDDSRNNNLDSFLMEKCDFRREKSKCEMFLKKIHFCTFICNSINFDCWWNKKCRNIIIWYSSTLPMFSCVKSPLKAKAYSLKNICWFKSTKFKIFKFFKIKEKKLNFWFFHVKLPNRVRFLFLIGLLGEPSDF